MRIAVLGPLEVFDDGAPVEIPGAKERLLLAALAAEAGSVVSTDRMVEAVWDGSAPATARKSLQVHVVHLRTALEPDRPRGSPGRYIVRRGAGYALALPREAVDACRAADLVAQGRARLAAGDPRRAVRSLSEALALWRGTPYGDWPDAPFADVERRRLAEVRLGALTALLDARLALGEHADVVSEAERLVAEDPLREESWRLLVLALYRSGRQGDALAAVARARRVLRELVGADPGPGLRAVEAAVLAQDPSLDLPPRSVPDRAAGTGMHPGVCPYKGLAAYQPEDVGLFHGRGRVTRTLVARLVDAPLLVVSGPSGAGKSSVVRAGLLPALAGGAVPGSEDWQVVVVTPGRRPVDRLAPLTGERPPQRPVVLVCDQFEELWASGADPLERGAFLDGVLALMDDDVVVRCVVVVRGDSVGRLAEHAAFTGRMGDRLVLVPPLTDDELGEVVRGPAATVGLDVEDELVASVVSDVRGRPSALPLVSTALVGTWERRCGDRLTLAGYLEAGGVSGALAETAEAAWTALDAPARETAHRLLLRLADVDDAGALVRRSVPFAELDLTGPGGVDRRAVVDEFVARRLLALDAERLEVAHEALFTAWPRLVRWLEEDAVGRTVRRHLAPAAQEWARRGEPEDELYRGARLAAALDRAATAPGELTAVERRFLDASRDRAESELREARERTRREAAGRRRTRRLATALAVLLAVASAAAVVAVRSQRAAERASLVADANRLAALSTAAGSLDVALLLAVQAQRSAATPETEDALLATLVEHPRAVRAVPLPGRIRLAELTDGGRSLLALLEEEVVAWRIGADRPGPAIRLDPETWGGRRTLTGVPDTDALVVAGEGRSGAWVRLVDGAGRHRLLAGRGLPGTPLAVGVSEDGDRVHLLTGRRTSETTAAWELAVLDAVTGTRSTTSSSGTLAAPVEQLEADVADDDPATAVVWADGTPVASLVDLRAGHVVPLAWQQRDAGLRPLRALSSGAAQPWDDGAVQLYDRSGRPVQLLAAHSEPVRDVVLAPNGTWAATVGEGGAVIVWDVDARTGQWEQRESLRGHAGDVVDAEIDATSSRLFTASADDTVIQWDLRPGEALGGFVPALSGRYISNRPQLIEPEGLLVAPTRSAGGASGNRRFPGPDTLGVEATFLDPATGRVVDAVPVGETLLGVSFGSSVAVSPDGRRVAVTWGLGATVLDTRTRDVLHTVELAPRGDVDDAGTPLPAEVVWSAAWTPEGDRLLLGVEGHLAVPGDGGLVVVDAATWEEADRLDVGEPQVLEADPDGGVIAFAREDSAEIVVMDARTLEVLRTVPLPQGSGLIYDLSFSSDGRLLAAGDDLGLLHLLDARTWQVRGEPANVHDDSVLQVEWLPDDRTVATAGADGRAALFDTDRELVRVRPLPASPEPGEGFAHVVPDLGEVLTVLSGERPGRRYPLDPAAWLQRACAVAGRDLTAAEWERFLPGRPYRPTCSDLQ